MKKITPLYENLSMVVSFTLIGLALYFVVDIPVTPEIQLIGMPISSFDLQQLLMAVCLGGLVFAGVGMIVSSHTEVQIDYSIPFWVNSVLLIILATWTLPSLNNPMNWGLGLIIVGILLFLTMLTEYRLIETVETSFNVAELWSRWVSYGLMLTYGIYIGQAGISLVFRIVGVACVAWLLASSIFNLHATHNKHVNRLSILVGLAIGQVMWFLAYWSVNSIMVGLMTFLFFYTICGLIADYLQEKLTRQVAIEYGVVMVLGLWAIMRIVG